MRLAEIGFVVLLVAGGAVQLGLVPGSWLGLVVAAGVFTGVWLLSLIRRDAGIVDVFWGPGLAVLAWLYLLTAEPGVGWRGLLLAVLASLWAARLAIHIAVRNTGRGEDFRYRQWREQAGAGFWWVSLFKVFLLQAAVAWVVASPMLAAQSSDGPGFGLLDGGGVALWLLGLGWEAVADWQLLRFSRNPERRGQVLHSGLWALSRHPNYFGEAVLWWGMGMVGLAAGGLLALVGPALLSFLLIKISGVAMLDRALVERKPGYADYVRTTPALVPLPRRWRRAAAMSETGS